MATARSYADLDDAAFGMWSATEKVMGWRQGITTCAWLLPSGDTVKYDDVDLCVLSNDARANDGWRCWNPRQDMNDALALVEAWLAGGEKRYWFGGCDSLGNTYARFGFHAEVIGGDRCVENVQPTLSAAICAAIYAAVEGEQCGS